MTAKIAADGQWRFPPCDSVPERFKTAIVYFEDKTFYDHFGVSPRGIARAIDQNLRNGRIVSGGSTISMQVIRMSRDNPRRTYGEKLLELIRAIRLESKYSKDEILKLYASNAPMGGNVVGIDAASWRYFGRGAHELSWAEAATLAVLPNAPSLIHPGKNRKRLIEKRNRLLKTLHEHGYFDQLTLDLSMSENLPDAPNPLPQNCLHLAQHLNSEKYFGKTHHLTLDNSVQVKANKILRRHLSKLKNNEIHNGAVLIANAKTGEILAYVGNDPDLNDSHHGYVDMIQAPRSTGSILKPFLFTAMIDEGNILPQMLVADVPMKLGAYTPKNFNQSFDGAVPADEALWRSLNIPAVRMLQDYGLEKFHHRLQQLGFSHIRKEAQHYGLSLVLGGAEASLWDIVSGYTHMTSSINEYYNEEVKILNDLNYLKNDFTTTPSKPIFSPGAINQCIQALQQVKRPSNEIGWENFSSSESVAWKTGTSFGFRDAWAVGMTRDLVIGVWVGNAEGTGRPDLVGVKAAAPILFDILDLFPGAEAFYPTYDEFVDTEICEVSGCRASGFCPSKKSIKTVPKGINAPICSYHSLVHLNEKGTNRVHNGCYDPDKIVRKSWFSLPPLQAFYFQKHNPQYSPLPAWDNSCSDEKIALMQWIYPLANTKMYLPKGLSGEKQSSIFEIAHIQPNKKVYWHLNNEFIGMTESIHQIQVQPSKGKYKLLVIDEDGNEMESEIEFL